MPCPSTIKKHREEPCRHEVNRIYHGQQCPDPGHRESNFRGDGVVEAGRWSGRGADGVRQLRSDGRWFGWRDRFRDDDVARRLAAAMAE